MFYAVLMYFFNFYFFFFISEFIIGVTPWSSCSKKHFYKIHLPSEYSIIQLLQVSIITITVNTVRFYDTLGI